MGINTTNRVFGLDIVRCIAILCVLAGHTIFMLPWQAATTAFSQFFLGYIGVEIFFVLSGYLVGKIFLELLRDQSFSFALVKHFWTRRWLRTLPAYYLVLVFYIILFYFDHHVFFFSARDNLLYLVFLQNSFSRHPDFFVHAWSLSVEEWFYLLLPLWILLFNQLSKRDRLLRGIIIAIVLITVFRIVIVIVYNPDWNEDIRMIVPLRLDSLMTGVLMAYIHIYYKWGWYKHAAILFRWGIGLFLLASAWLCLDAIPDHRMNWFLSKTLLFNFFSLSVAFCMPFMSTIRQARSRFAGMLITWISLRSYSLYLIHILCIFLVSDIYSKVFGREIVLVKFLCSWIVFLIVAAFLYRFYERPFMDLRDKTSDIKLVKKSA